MGFVAYDCSNATNRVDAYSLLEPSACPTSKHHHEFQRIIFGEIVQVKKDRKVRLLLHDHLVCDEPILQIQLSSQSGPVSDL